MDNFNVEFNKLNEIIDSNKADIEQLKELMSFGQQLASGTISTDGLAKCLSMVKEFEDKDVWLLNGGSSAGFYLNVSNNYKKLYLKYKTKYLHSKHN